ncbi:acyltransferase family protein [Liquorilactobacillus capillatus]|uniref:acyltransferase family protein n=1 Tax=Liquorilactobacillus capillatus TaxID=480931 RepID=UPI000708AC28|nr:acyltransferase family protein [Liquorilactobacillus capillatus]
MKRVEWIDVVRGLAMVMIVVGHSLYGYTFSAFARTLFAVHVPVFFVLSGYLFTQKKWKVLFHKGKLNLLLPYMATCLLIIILS